MGGVGIFMRLGRIRCFLRWGRVGTLGWLVVGVNDRFDALAAYGNVGLCYGLMRRTWGVFILMSLG